jgi:hypothetical protein
LRPWAAGRRDALKITWRKTTLILLTLHSLPLKRVASREEGGVVAGPRFDWRSTVRRAMK